MWFLDSVVIKLNYTKYSIMSWTEEKVNKLKDLWGKGQTASQIAEIIGGISRNAVIGKAHRLNLSAKIKARSSISQNKIGKLSDSNNILKKGRKHRFRSLLIDKNFNFFIFNTIYLFLIIMICHIIRIFII